MAHWRHAVVVCLVALTAAAVSPVAGATAGRHERVPKQLLKRFPLNPQTQPRSATTSTAQPSRPRPPAARANRGSGLPLIWVLFVVACLLVVLGFVSPRLMPLLAGRSSPGRPRRARPPPTVMVPPLVPPLVPPPPVPPATMPPAARGERAASEHASPDRRPAVDSGDPAGAFERGRKREGQGDLGSAYRQATASEHAAAALRLGVLRKDRGDLDGAASAFRAAEERGDAAGAAGLGGLSEMRGDRDGAMAAYERAAARGHGAAALRLGVLRERAGDVAGAEAAYREAADRGIALGAFRLGRLFAKAGDRDRAESAFRRACEIGDGDVLEHARAALQHLR
jgi:hypothetical protein